MKWHNNCNKRAIRFAPPLLSFFFAPLLLSYCCLRRFRQLFFCCFPRTLVYVISLPMHFAKPSILDLRLTCSCSQPFPKVP